MGTDTKPTIDERVERLEQLAARLIDLAGQHPVGRAILRKLGLE
jgi:hypothetical protein